MGVFSRIIDNRQANSFANTLRKRRFALLEALMAPLIAPIHVLDIGGTQLFWENMRTDKPQELNVVILNLFENEVTQTNFTSVIGDARKMPMFKDGEFDVVFSNSVIEHVGTYQDQEWMAKEVERVGQRYFVQTPNRYFPIEPHFVFPYFQFLPLGLQIFLVRHFNLGWFKKIPDEQEAMQAIQSIRLLTEAELRQLFPGAKLYRETFFGLTKSFVVYNGWSD